MWFRISERIKIPQPFAPNFKEQIWNYVKSQDIFEYFEIPENRGSLQSYSRDDFFYNEDHDEIESKLESSYYLYKFCPIEENTTIFGSCEHFKTRMKVSIVELMDSSVQQVEEKYQQKLVIVANQKVRSSILIPNCLNTDVELVNITYCLLERIGRSRYFGEMNSGKFSLGKLLILCLIHSLFFNPTFQANSSKILVCCTTKEISCSNTNSLLSSSSNSE